MILIFITLNGKCIGLGVSWPKYPEGVKCGGLEAITGGINRRGVMSIKEVVIYFS